ncbi:MAG: amino acid ABC transporter substrate-binding protein [Deltaproteobacteria bacterium]|nr:amino acid ABC transporter substrate-binding protein [Deltaproteobacteria bacterium]
MFGKKSNSAGLFILVLAVGLSSFTCSKEADENAIRVGAIVSMTGMNAMTGYEQKWAYEQAISDINKNGGVYVQELDKKMPIKLIFADDKSMPDQGAAAMERLIKINKIDLALSSNVTPINIAAGTKCEQYKVYYQIVCSWIDFIERESFRWVSDMFASSSESSRAPFLIWQRLREDQRPRRPALMMEDNLDGQGFGQGFKKFAREYAYQFAVDEPYAPGSKDFSSHILKWKAAGVDALIWLGSPTDGITLLRQMKEQDLRLKYIHGWKGFWTTEFVEDLGKESNYIIHDGFWTEKSGAPGAQELGERFRKEFKKDSVSVGLYYANPQILAMAIEKAGSYDSAKVRDAVFGGEFMGTVMGDVKFNDKGLAFKPLIALQWWNGERMPVYPPVPDVWELKLAPMNEMESL